MKEITVIDSSDGDSFSKEVNEHLAKGWDVSSTSCGFVDSEEYSFCMSLQAILIREIPEAE